MELIHANMGINLQHIIQANPVQLKQISYYTK